MGVYLSRLVVVVGVVAIVCSAFTHAHVHAHAHAHAQLNPTGPVATGKPLPLPVLVVPVPVPVRDEKEKGPVAKANDAPAVRPRDVRAVNAGPANAAAVVAPPIAPRRPSCSPGAPRLTASTAENGLGPKRGRAHAWLRDLRARDNTPAPRKFPQTPVRDLFMMGSHDAGTAAVDLHRITGLFTKPSAFVTQSYTVRDQLCLGARYFDLRFKMFEGQFRVWHGAAGCNGYFATDATIWDDVAGFLADHKYEIVFLRIKVEGGDVAQTQQFWGTLYEKLHSYAETTTNHDSREPIFDRTLAQIWNDKDGNEHPAGRVFIMRYKCEKTVKLFGPFTKSYGCVVTDYGDQRDIQFEAALSIGGRYSDTHKRHEIAVKLEPVTKDVKDGKDAKDRKEDRKPVKDGESKKALPLLESEGLGQLDKWRVWNSLAYSKPMLSLWWTATGTIGAMSVKENTAQLYAADGHRELVPDGAIIKVADPMFTLYNLYDTANAEGCDFGTFLVVDFVGDSAVQNVAALSAERQRQHPDMVFDFVQSVSELRMQYRKPEVKANEDGKVRLWPKEVCEKFKPSEKLKPVAGAANAGQQKFKQISASITAAATAAEMKVEMKAKMKAEGTEQDADVEEDATEEVETDAEDEDALVDAEFEADAAMDAEELDSE